jgi:hypothetical protein
MRFPHFVGKSNVLPSYHISCTGCVGLGNIILGYINASLVPVLLVFQKLFRRL